MRYIALIATVLATGWLSIWLMWRHTLATLLAGGLVVAALCLLATVRKRGRRNGTLMPRSR